MIPLLKKSFKSSKCKTQAKLTLARIKLLRNKKVVLVKQSRKDVGDLLRAGQESNARIRVENVYREENSLAAYELIQQYCEAVISRLSILESQKDCPSDMKEPIAGLIYAAPRCADLPELQKIRDLFILKYGKEFTVAAAELRQDCGVSVEIIQKLSSHPPNGKTKLKLLKDIAAEHKIAWDSNEDVYESFKISEDLLDGPSHFVSASEVSQTNLPAQTVSEREISDSRPSIPSDLKGSSAPAPLTESRLKTFLSPYASPFQASPAFLSGLSSSKLQADKGGKSLKTPDVGCDIKIEGIMNHKSMDKHWIQRDPGHDSLKSEADPYVRAKAEGRMDYGNTFAKTNEAHHESQKKEEKVELTQESGVPHRVHPKADPYVGANAEGRMDHGSISFKAPTNGARHESLQKEEKIEVTQGSTVPHHAHPKAEEHRVFNKENSDNGAQWARDSQDERHNEMPVFSQEIRDGKLARHQRPPSLKLTKSFSTERKDGGSPYPDVATAAQVAFESAALAAEAAKAAIDLVSMESRMKSNLQMDEADGLERDNELKSKHKVEKVTQSMRNTDLRMDSEQNLQRGEHEERIFESEDETLEETLTPLEEIVSPSRADVYSAGYQRSLGFSELHAATGVNDSAVEGKPRNMHREISREQKERILSHNQEMSFFGIDDQLGAQDRKFDGVEQSCFSDQISQQDLVEVIQEDGPDNVFGSTWVNPSTSCQMERFEKEDTQKIPRFDDYESDATDTDTPFYTKGQCATGKERYGQAVSSLSVNYPKPFSFIDPDSDSGEETTFENLKFTTKSHDRDFVQEEAERFAGWAYSGKPEFDNYDEPMGFSGLSISGSISQPLFVGHSHGEERFKGSDNDYTGVRGNSSPERIIIESDRYTKLDKSNNKLKWHSSTSEEHGSPSQSGELSSEADELHLANLHSHKFNEARAYQQGWDPGAKEVDTVEKKTYRKLKWYSFTSDESDIPSQSDKLCPEAEEFCAVKPPSQNENGQRSQKLDEFIGPQGNRRPETPDPLQGHEEIGSKTLKGKPFYGESRRSVRLSTSQQRQEPTVRYESANSSLPSVFETAHSDGKDFKF